GAQLDRRDSSAEALRSSSTVDPDHRFLEQSGPAPVSVRSGSRGIEDNPLFGCVIAHDFLCVYAQSGTFGGFSPLDFFPWIVGARDIRTSLWRRVHRCLQSKPFCHSSGQVINSHRGVNLDGGQLQRLRFVVEAVGEHGIALEQVAEGSLRVACFPKKSPFRSPSTIEHSLTELGSREQPDSVTMHCEERLYQVWQQ